MSASAWVSASFIAALKPSLVMVAPVTASTPIVWLASTASTSMGRAAAPMPSVSDCSTTSIPVILSASTVTFKTMLP